MGSRLCVVGQPKLFCEQIVVMIMVASLHDQIIKVLISAPSMSLSLTLASWGWWSHEVCLPHSWVFGDLVMGIPRCLLSPVGKCEFWWWKWVLLKV